MARKLSDALEYSVRLVFCGHGDLVSVHYRTRGTIEQGCGSSRQWDIVYVRVHLR